MKNRLLTAAATLGLVALAGCGGGSSPLDTSTPSASGSAAAGSIVVGSANFPESALLAEIYAGALKAKGVNASTKLNIGAREVYIPALQDGSIDLLPEYTGVLLQYFDKSATAVTPDDVYAALQKALPANFTVLEKSSAEDKDAVVVTKETADKYHLTSIADLAPVASQLVLGGPPEWPKRPTGLPGLKKVYGLTFKEFKPLDVAGPLSVQALKSGQVAAVDLFTTQSAIAANNFVVLQDPKSLFAAQNVVPLITKSKADPTVTAALNAVSAKLDTPTLAGLVKQVEVDKTDAATVAKNWLSQNGLA
jgi:osmoprotectant transport system substrate-binding protein